MAGKKPEQESRPEDFVKYSEGFADIQLSRALNIGGAPVTALRMREPTVRDNLSYDEMKGSDARKELNVFANLMEMDPKHIEALPIRDYRRVTAAYAGFLD